MTGSICLMQHLPPMWDRIVDMKEIQNAIEKELTMLLLYADDCFSQKFFMTATKRLDHWEMELSLPINHSKSYRHRREMIQAKLLGTGTTTIKMVQRTAAAFSGGEVEVIDVPSEYRFEVKFVGIKGIPANIEDLKQIIEEIKPAHLSYTLTYTYTVWRAVKPLTWKQVHQKTWDQLRIYEECKSCKEGA